MSVSRVVPASLVVPQFPAGTYTASITEDASYDRGIPFFGKNVLRVTGLLNP